MDNLTSKQEIQTKLKEIHQRFVDVISNLDDHEFMSAPNEKWTAGQQLDHIRRSVVALNQGLTVPKFLLRLYVGKANRPTRTYDAVVAKYKLRLEAGGKAVGRFIPKPVSLADRSILTEKLTRAVDILCTKIDGFSEQQLDDYIMPHPLLGKMTIREMLYFMIYHAEHHQKLTLKNLGK